MEAIDKFIAHGSYTWSNSCGYLVQISDCGDGARLNIDGLITDWFEIEHVYDDDTEDYEATIDPTGYNVPLYLVMRLNF